MKEFYGYVEVHAFLIRPKDYKIGFLCVEGFISKQEKIQLIRRIANSLMYNKNNKVMLLPDTINNTINTL